jgi:very-short-patch-repair endonuclease
MKKSTITLADLKRSKVAHLNQKVFEELENAKKSRKKRVPSQPCRQVLWMGGQLVAWSLESGIYVEKEHHFAKPQRRWRFDFALPDKKIAIEYEGIHSEKSRHTTVSGYQGDIEKYNAAQALGWKVIRLTAKTYKTVLKELEKNIEQ